MKKCVIFFTLLLITLWIAVITDVKEPPVADDEVATEVVKNENLIAEDLGHTQN